jgi:hypothetical protein
VPVFSPVCSRSSKTIRTARSRSSTEYFLGGAIAPHPYRYQGLHPTRGAPSSATPPPASRRGQGRSAPPASPPSS